MTLQVRGLCKAYGQVVVADAIDIDLSVGQCLGVIGPNGAGKSSLFHLLTGTVGADAGHIALDGKTISGLPAHWGWETEIVTTPDGLPWIGPHRNFPFHFFTLGFGWHGDGLAWLAAKAALRHLTDDSRKEDEAFGFVRHLG